MTDEEQMFNWMMGNNLGCVALFHNHIDTVLKVKVKEIQALDDIDEKNRIYWKHIYEKNFPAQLRETSFLLMFGHLEEMLYLLWRDKNINSILLGRGHGVSKFKLYIKDMLGAEFGKCKDYQYICDAQKIRNSLLHIGGRVSLSRESKNLKAIIKKNSVLYSIELDRVHISYEGLLGLQRAIRSLTEELFKKSIPPTAS